MLLESLAAPLLLTLLAAGIGRSLDNFKRVWPGLAIMAGFFTAYALSLGAPPWPPRSASQKLPYVMLFGTLLGATLAGATVRLAVGRMVAGRMVTGAWPLLVVLWLGWRPLVAGDGATVLLLLALGAVGMIICAPPHPVERGTRHLTMLAITAFGLAGLAVLGQSLSLGQLALALAAALAGTGLATRSTAVDQILLGASGTLLALATTLALFSEANRIALLLLTAVFAADWTTRQFAPTAGAARVVFAICCLVPLLLAMILARLV